MTENKQANILYVNDEPALVKLMPRLFSRNGVESVASVHITTDVDTSELAKGGNKIIIADLDWKLSPNNGHPTNGIDFLLRVAQHNQNSFRFLSTSDLSLIKTYGATVSDNGIFKDEKLVAYSIFVKPETDPLLAVVLGILNGEPYCLQSYIGPEELRPRIDQAKLARESPDPFSDEHMVIKCLKEWGSFMQKVKGAYSLGEPECEMQACRSIHQPPCPYIGGKTDLVTTKLVDGNPVHGINSFYECNYGKPFGR